MTEIKSKETNHKIDITTISNEFESLPLEDKHEIINILGDISNYYNECHFLWRKYAFNHIIPLKEKELWDKFNKYSSFFDLLSDNEEIISFACYALHLMMIEENAEQSITKAFTSEEEKAQ